MKNLQALVVLLGIAAAVGPMVAMALAAEGGGAKKRPSQAEQLVNELTACADNNDGKCVQGLADALKKNQKEACTLLAGSLGMLDRRASLVVESMVTLACPQTLAIATAYIEGSDSEKRMEVFEAACLLRDKALLDLAQRFLAGNRGYEKERTCFALGRMQIPEAIPLLLKATADGMYAVRQEAATALGNYKGKDVAETLCKVATKDANAGVRAQAVWSLKKVGSWDTLPCLFEALADREPTVHVAAHEALMTVAGIDLGTRPVDWQDWWKNGAKKPQ